MYSEFSEEPVERVQDRGGQLWQRFKKYSPMVRRATLAGGVLAVLLAMVPMPKHSDYPRDHSLQSLNTKMELLQSQLTEGRPHLLRLDEGELFWWLKTQHSRIQSAVVSDEEKPLFSSLELKGLSLGQHHMELHTAFTFLGKTLTLNVTGRPMVEHRYLDLDLSGARLGLLPIPQPLFTLFWERVLDSPLGKRDRRLPLQVNQIELGQGELLVHYRDFVSAIL